MRARSWGWLGLVMMICMVMLAACGPTVSIARHPTRIPATPTAPATCISSATIGRQPTAVHMTTGGVFEPQPYSPAQIRDAYGITSLLRQGITGKGQTVVLIESYGDPTLQDDLDQFSTRYGLPPVTVHVLAPLGTVPFDPSNSEMTNWAGETALDAEIVHAIAPDAGIVVMTSPVDETFGIIGLSQFRQLEEQAVSQHLGAIISQSWGSPEVTLAGAACQAEIAQWSSFYQQATTKQGITFITGSGDAGASDFLNVQQTELASSQTSSFPADEPWVTAVGGTELLTDGQGNYKETSWTWNSCSGGASGGGFSQFSPTPDFQKALPASTRSDFNGHRGVPDVAADGAPCSGWNIRVLGNWAVIGGTSAGSPLWAGLAALADQMAGHPLGFINPALYAIGISSKAAQDFRDITQGNNSVDAMGVRVQGYSAGTGWDPVTGFGSPIADHLLPDLVAAAQGGLA